MFRLKKQFYFLTTVGFGRGIIPILIFIVDYKFDDKITGQFSADIALVSLFSFIVMLGGSVAIYREGCENKSLALPLLNSHILLGLILLYCLFYINILDISVYSLSLLIYSSELIESYLRSINKDLEMMIISSIKFFSVVSFFWFLDINCALTVISYITTLVIIIFLILNSRIKKSNFGLIKPYSWYSLFIGIFAWVINSSDKYIASKLIALESLRDYSITYTLGLPIILFGSVLNLIYSREYFNGRFDFETLFKSYVKWILFCSTIVYFFQFVIHKTFFSAFDLPYIFFINLSMIFISVYGFLQLPLIKSRKLHFILVISIICGVFNLVLNIIGLQFFSWRIMYFTTLVTSLLSFYIIFKKLKHEIIDNIA